MLTDHDIITALCRTVKQLAEKADIQPPLYRDADGKLYRLAPSGGHFIQVDDFGDALKPAVEGVVDR
jgi:hypothetical protein